MPDTPLLSVHGLTAGFETNRRVLPVVRDVTFSIQAGETLGLVGESGSGKSVAALSILRLLRPPGRILAGQAFFRGRDLLAMREREIRAVRGAGIGFVFQEPMSALNPVFTVGDQVAEAMVMHGETDWGRARARALDLLAAVRIADPARCAGAYPHQLSGGMRQRAMIAVALACRPPLLIADEPTTALDATIQAEILDLLTDLRERFQLALLLISHDLGVVARVAQRVLVMYAGSIVEDAPVRRLYHTPHHPYTRTLLSAVISRGTAAPPREPGFTSTAPAGEPGCPFAPRCPDRFEPCSTEQPVLHEVSPGHRARCHLYRAVATDAAR